MPTWLTDFKAWHRLGARLVLSGGITRPPQIAEVILPVLDLNPLLQDFALDSITKNLTAAAGTFTIFFTTPVGRRWHVHNWMRGGTTGSTRCRVRDPASGKFLTLSSGSTGENVNSRDFHMESGWELGMDTTGNAADTAAQMELIYSEEVLVPK